MHTHYHGKQDPQNGAQCLFIHLYNREQTAKVEMKQPADGTNTRRGLLPSTPLPTYTFFKSWSKRLH